MRSGSGVRLRASKPAPLTMSPRQAGRLVPPTVSVSAVRGLANWPAMRATVTTSPSAASPIIAAIRSSRLKLRRTRSAPNSANVSAQSPPWSRKPRPAATPASFAVSVRLSAGGASGAVAASADSAVASARESG